MPSTRSEIKISEERRPCIWMQTGVVRSKYCENDYRCTECRFERGMRRAVRRNSALRKSGKRPRGKRGGIVPWEEKVKALPPSKRPCIHHLKQRINFKACTNDYRCTNCEFDQYFYDECSVHTVITPVDVLEVRGFKIPQGYYLHAGHTWAKIEEGALVRVGFDEFALRLLGPLDHVEAPLMGKELKQGRPDISIVRGANQAKAVSPVSGVVTAINVKLREKGKLANQAPYSEGWVMTVHSNTLRQDLKNLMIHNETKEFLGQELDRLHEMIEEVAGPLAVDGGDLGSDIYGNMPQLGWDRVVKRFLRSG